MHSFILGVGYSFCCSRTAFELQCAGGVVTALTTISFIRCALSNPGVIPAQSRNILPNKETGHTKQCEVCQIVQPKGCYHCTFCNVCVEDHDHHCPWMGKCIG